MSENCTYRAKLCSGNYRGGSSLFHWWILHLWSHWSRHGCYTRGISRSFVKFFETYIPSFKHSSWRIQGMLWGCQIINICLVGNNNFSLLIYCTISSADFIWWLQHLLVGNNNFSSLTCCSISSADFIWWLQWCAGSWRSIRWRSTKQSFNYQPSPERGFSN
jgi:hypothetical protein